MPTDFIYPDQLTDRIALILSKLDLLITCQPGDLSNLPAPENLKDYLPGIYIDPMEVGVEFADGNTLGDILNSTYDFSLFYVRKYEDNENIKRIMSVDTKVIAKKLFQHRRLGLTPGNKNEFFDIPGEGLVIAAIPTNISFETYMFETYKEHNVNLAVSEISYKVYFRTYK